VKQRVGVGSRIEIASSRFLVEKNVGKKQSGGDEASPEIEKLRWQEEDEGQDRADGKHREQGGKNPANAALVKRHQGKARCRHLGCDERGDQIAGDDEKDVDADISAGDARQARMEQHHGHDRNRAKSINVTAVTHAPPRNGRYQT
jgi:hypothetical protein